MAYWFPLACIGLLGLALVLIVVRPPNPRMSPGVSRWTRRVFLALWVVACVLVLGLIIMATPVPADVLHVGALVLLYVVLLQQLVAVRRVRARRQNTGLDTDQST